jgi:hypothetical protein
MNASQRNALKTRIDELRAGNAKQHRERMEALLERIAVALERFLFELAKDVTP